MSARESYQWTGTSSSGCCFPCTMIVTGHAGEAYPSMSRGASPWGQAQLLLSQNLPMNRIIFWDCYVQPSTCDFLPARTWSPTAWRTGGILHGDAGPSMPKIVIFAADPPTSWGSFSTHHFLDGFTHRWFCFPTREDDHGKHGVRARRPGCVTCVSCWLVLVTFGYVPK